LNVIRIDQVLDVFRECIFLIVDFNGQCVEIRTLCLLVLNKIVTLTGQLKVFFNDTCQYIIIDAHG
jgi:hypothetical protein